MKENSDSGKVIIIVVVVVIEMGKWYIVCMLMRIIPHYRKGGWFRKERKQLLKQYPPGADRTQHLCTTGKKLNKLNVGHQYSLAKLCLVMLAFT